jgi:hypothetical protein
MLRHAGKAIRVATAQSAMAAHELRCAIPSTLAMCGYCIGICSLEHVLPSCLVRPRCSGLIGRTSAGRGADGDNARLRAPASLPRLKQMIRRVTCTQSVTYATKAATPIA